jgi:uncharacterized protein YeaO (DUF488 family)
MDTQTTGLTYTYIEVQELLNSLSEADIARLLQIYRVMGCGPRAGLDAQDVFSEVACKVLAMERAWPREVDTLAYLVGTGRSVISNEEKKYVREVAADPDVIDGVEVEPHAAEPWMDVVAPSPDIQAAQCQTDATLYEWIEKIQELFVGDENAACFIAKKLEEMKKSAILLACGFTEQVYRNVEKRIKDKVRKRFPQGFPWWEIT